MQKLTTPGLAPVGLRDYIIHQFCVKQLLGFSFFFVAEVILSVLTAQSFACL
jgi:hypothetical protein